MFFPRYVCVPITCATYRVRYVSRYVRVSVIDGINLRRIRKLTTERGKREFSDTPRRVNKNLTHAFTMVSFVPQQTSKLKSKCNDLECERQQLKAKNNVASK